MIVADASVLVEAALNSGPDGAFAVAALRHDPPIAAPHIAPAEAASVLRRFAANGVISDSEASLALREIVDAPLELYPFARVADRVWQLRPNVTPYDAWYVALAEALDIPLVTLDLRLASAPGPRCRFLTP